MPELEAMVVPIKVVFINEILNIKKLDERAVIPSYQSKHASGFDLCAIEDMKLWPGQTALVGTGLAFEVPEGMEMQIRARSGYALKTPTIVKNAPGTIDSDYRGEVKIIMHNMGDTCHYIKAGERVAQAVICPVVHAIFNEVEELSETKRGAGGFGSTGSEAK